MARQEALERATNMVNQEGHFRQKAEALKTVIDRIVCDFSRGKRCTLKSIDLYAAEDAAVRPLTFPVNSLQTDWCLCAFVASFLRDRLGKLRVILSKAKNLRGSEILRFAQDDVLRRSPFSFFHPGGQPNFRPASM